MEGSSKRIKLDDALVARTMLEVPGHLSTRNPAHQDFPPFPGLRRSGKLSWLPMLVENVTLTMSRCIRQWKLEGLVVHAKRQGEIWLDWACMGALVELWHPQTHTFVFPTFEATILLEEAELLLGLKKTHSEDVGEMMTMGCPVSECEVLRSFMGDTEEIRDIMVTHGIDLGKLATWVLKALPKAKRDEEVEDIMKGFTICLAGALLFPAQDNILEGGQLSAVQGIWEGKRVGPAVLAYLYSGLTASSLGRPPFGSMLLFARWIDFHLKFDFNMGNLGMSRIFERSPLFNISSALGMDDLSVVNRVPKLKKRSEWRGYFKTMARSQFTRAPSVMSRRDVLVRPTSSFELRLIGATEFVLYAAHRAWLQIGLPHRGDLELPHPPSVRLREIGTRRDVDEAKSIVDLWKMAVPRHPGAQEEGDHEE